MLQPVVLLTALTWKLLAGRPHPPPESCCSTTVWVRRECGVGGAEVVAVNIVGRVLERRKGSARGEIRNCRLLFIGIPLPGRQYMMRTKHWDHCVTSPVKSEGAVRKWSRQLWSTGTEVS
ncbi:hypothetical protein E2C01_004977 [Portunus trituberculatus]|uniref:Secreted protein n=1 Tax=Portunus trituberculatus TaxID=210409 RepID=A0A5B7CUE3_PORTR|nr:hypothetical protein [Portunus trituberculatus]